MLLACLGWFRCRLVASCCMNSQIYSAACVQCWVSIVCFSLGGSSISISSGDLVETLGGERAHVLTMNEPNDATFLWFLVREPLTWNEAFHSSLRCPCNFHSHGSWARRIRAAPTSHRDAWLAVRNGQERSLDYRTWSSQRLRQGCQPLHGP